MLTVAKSATAKYEYSYANSLAIDPSLEVAIATAHARALLAMLFQTVCGLICLIFVVT